jgi:hypothetical protein
MIFVRSAIRFQRTSPGLHGTRVRKDCDYKLKIDGYRAPAHIENGQGNGTSFASLQNKDRCSSQKRLIKWLTDILDVSKIAPGNDQSNNPRMVAAHPS